MAKENDNGLLTLLRLPRVTVPSRPFSAVRTGVAFFCITVQDIAQPGLVVDSYDRRRNPRYLCGGDAQLTLVPSDGAVLSGRLRNLGLGGCFIETGSPLEVGTRTEVLVRVNMLCFRAMSLVRAVQQRSGLGLEFIRLSAGGQSALSELVFDLRRWQALLNRVRAGGQVILPEPLTHILPDRLRTKPMIDEKPALPTAVAEMLGPEPPVARRCRQIFEFHSATNVLDLFA